MVADVETQQRPRRAKGHAVRVVSIVLVLLVAAGTTTAVVLYGGDPEVTGQAVAPPEPTEEEEPLLVVVVADDGKSQVTVPEVWGPADGVWRAEGSALHVGKASRGHHVAVYAEDKADFVSFDAFDSSVRAALEDDKEISDLRKPRRRTVGGLRAVEHSFRFEEDGMKSSYLLVTVKGKAAYYEVQGWANTHDKEWPDMDTIGAVIDSFREVTDGSKG